MLLGTRLRFMVAHCVLLAGSPLIADEAASYQFRGVEPGVTTQKALLDSDRWGQPALREKLADGSTWLEFRVRSYKKIGILLRGDKVQSVDITLPDDVGAATAASALKLGSVVEGEGLPFAALLGGPTDDAWQASRYSAGRVALFVDQAGQAKLVRAYAAEVIDDTASVPAPAANVAPDALPPEPSASATALKGQNALSRQIVAAVTKILATQHLSKHPVDDEIAQRTLDLFFKQLDPQKMYLNQDDVGRFRRRYDLLDDQLRSGDLSMVYEIAEVFLQRVGERVALAQELVERQHDFGIDELLETDADKTIYAENALEMKEIWRKRIKYELLAQKAAGNDLDESRRLVRQRFNNFLARMQNLEDDELRDMLLNSLCAAYDPHSSYISQQQIENFQINTAAQMYGIGAAQQIVNGYVTIQRVIPNSPAARDGRLKPGDRILAVGQGDDGPLVDIVNAKLNDAVNLIRGEDGTIVRLRVLPEGEFESTVYQLTRGKIELNQIGQALLTGDELPAGRAARVGFVRLPSFYLDMQASKEGGDYRAVSRDLKRILEEFQTKNVDVIVLDLRNNGGGSLTEAIELLGLFIDDQPLAVQVKGHDQQVQAYNAQRFQPAWNGPLVVLTNTVSAGGSEIFAAAIQDYQRGLLIGDKQTHGLGTVASAVEIGPSLFGSADNPPKLGYTKLVFQKYYRPNGDSMQLRGVTPDVPLPSLMDVMSLTEKNHAFALKFDRVPAGQYTKLSESGLNDPLRSQLRANSEARRAGSDFFLKLASSIAKYQATKDQPVPLSESKFMARRAAEQDEEVPTIPGIPEAKLDGYFQEVLAITLDYTARLLVKDGDSHLQQQEHADAQEAYQRAVAADPEFAIGRYKLAWQLATCPQAALRDGPLAVQHAEKACQLDNWKSWHYVLALSIAQAEAGDFDKAQKHVKTALEMAPQDKRGPYLYLQERFQQRTPFRAR